ncbi:MAG: glycosyltransferase family 4 protein [Bacteroidetes bacterium]|nr:glycosyltransferase family 4 protein [Bacteroidota bacterium]MBI3483349.1 glycosyltransferase family 4 protein [Bacteroidota bacterium]
MKILLIHNKYKQPGGEDNVFESEGELLSKHGHFVERLVFENSTIRTFVDEYLSGLKAIYNPQSAWEFRDKIMHFNPDIIHVHNFVPLVSPAIFFVAKEFNIPIILTLHNYRLICPSATLVYKGKIYEQSIHSLFPVDAIMKGVYRNSKLQTAAVAIMVALHNLIGTWKNKVDFYITLSNFAKEKFRTSALAIPEERLVVKPNFVPDFGIGHSMRNDELLFIGRLVEEKGIQILLKAIKILQFNLTIIGDGPLRKLVTDAAKTNPNIHYLGFQDKASIANHLKKCKALIFPSIWYEGFPLTILEAFSTGTLVIASRLGAMAEIIQDRVNGLLFEAGNEIALANKIVEMDAEPEWAKHLAENARLSYLQHYTPEKNYGLLVRIYSKAMALKHQGQDDQFINQSMPALSHS